MKFFLLVLSYILLACNYSIAQSSLRGIIKNDRQDILPYSTVALSRKDSSAPMVTQADSVAFFSFSNLPYGHYTLSAYALGYTKYTASFNIRRDTIVHITLEPLKSGLKGITVTGSKPVIEEKPDRIIFNVANSISAAGSNGLDVLKKAPGIIINDKAVSLAGKGDLAIMVNGQLLHLSDKALMDYLKSFSSSQISRIEIITLPSAQYDAEGNAGLINIITKKSRQAGLSGNIDGSIKRFFYKDQPDYKGIQNYGDIDGSTGLYYSNKKWSAYTNLNYSAGRELWGYGIDVNYPDKHWAMKDTGEYRVATFNVLTGTDYHLNHKTTLGFEYNYIYHLEDGADYVRVPVYNPKGQLDSTLKTYATYFPIAISNAFNLHLIQALNQSGARLTLNADYFNFYRHDKSHLITQSYTGDGKPESEKTRRLYDTTLQNIRIYTFKADVELPTTFAQFSFGSKFSFINNYSDIYYFDVTDGKLTLDSGLSNEFRYIENTQAFYVNGSKNAGLWQLDAGLRSELTETKAVSYFQNQAVNKHYLRLFPAVSVSYKLNGDNVFSFNYNKRIQRPTFWNLNPFKSFMTAYTYVEGNPYLEPEYITNVQLSHRYKSLLTSSLYMNIIQNGFAQVVEAHDTGSYIHTTTMLNYTQSYRYGISEALSLHPFEWFETNNQASAYYTRVYSDLAYISNLAGPGLFLETNNTLYFNREKSFSGNAVFWYQFPEVDHSGRSNAYYNLDIGLQLLTLKKRLSLSLNFSDLLQSSASKIYNTVDQLRNTYTSFQLNSQIRLSASWNFGHGNRQNKPETTGNESERNRL